MKHGWRIAIRVFTKQALSRVIDALPRPVTGTSVEIGADRATLSGGDGAAGGVVGIGTRAIVEQVAVAVPCLDMATELTRELSSHCREQ